MARSVRSRGVSLTLSSWLQRTVRENGADDLRRNNVAAIPQIQKLLRSMTSSPIISGRYTTDAREPVVPECLYVPSRHEFRNKGSIHREPGNRQNRFPRHPQQYGEEAASVETPIVAVSRLAAQARCCTDHRRKDAETESAGRVNLSVRNRTSRRAAHFGVGIPFIPLIQRRVAEASNAVPINVCSSRNIVAPCHGPDSAPKK
jgi:hypothetical protein